jgi:hypothetical protein
VLWKAYVEETVSEQHANILFTSLMKENIPAGVGNKFLLLQDKVAKGFFDEVLCHGSLSLCGHRTPSGFTCFKTYLNWVNEKLLLPSTYIPGSQLTGTEEKAPLEQFQGLKALWVFAFQTEMRSIRDQAVELLVSIIEKLCTKFKTQRAQITEQALATALATLDDSRNGGRVRMALEIIDAIIERHPDTLIS